MPRAELDTFVVRSLAVLRREAPGSYARLCSVLQGRRLCIDDGDARFALVFAGGHVTCRAADGHEAIRIGVDRATILALVDGDLPLHVALRDEHLRVHAPVLDAALAFDGFQIYVRGAIRCPTLPLLLDEFRSAS